MQTRSSWATWSALQTWSIALASSYLAFDDSAALLAGLHLVSVVDAAIPNDLY